MEDRAMRISVPFSPQPKPKAKRREAERNRLSRKFRDAAWATHRLGGPKGEEYAACAVCKQLTYRGVDGTVDHIKMRSTHPELRYDVSNSRIVHSWCNRQLKANKALRESLI